MDEDVAALFDNDDDDWAGETAIPRDLRKVRPPRVRTGRQPVLSATRRPISASQASAAARMTSGRPSSAASPSRTFGLSTGPTSHGNSAGAPRLSTSALTRAIEDVVGQSATAVQTPQRDNDGEREDEYDSNDFITPSARSDAEDGEWVEDAHDALRRNPTGQVAGSSINVARMLRYAGVDPYAPPQPQHQPHRDRQQVPGVPLDTGRVGGGGGRADDATWDDSVAESAPPTGPPGPLAAKLLSSLGVSTPLGDWRRAQSEEGQQPTAIPTPVTQRGTSKSGPAHIYSTGTRLSRPSGKFLGGDAGTAASRGAHSASHAALARDPSDAALRAFVGASTLHRSRTSSGVLTGGPLLQPVRSQRRRSAALGSLGVLGPHARQQTTAWGVPWVSATTGSSGPGRQHKAMRQPATSRRGGGGGGRGGVTIDGVYFPSVQELLERKGLVL